MTTDPDGSATEPLTAVAADLVLHNARIWTGLGCDEHDGPTAIAITRDAVAAVGAENDVAGWTTARTTVVDVGGRRVVPGLIDSHIHAVRAGISYLDELDWTEVHSVSAALESVRDAAALRPEGCWIPVLGGWHPTQFRDEKRMPTPAELTAAAPNHPVFVHPLYGHDDHAVLNDAGLAALALSGASDAPEGAELGTNLDGSLDGTVRGLAFYQYAAQAALRPTHERAVESTRAFFHRLAALGLTGVIDAGGLGMAPEKYRAVRALWRVGGLPIRVRLNHGAVTRGAEAREVATWLDVLDPGFGDDLLAVLGIGEVLHFGCHDWEGMTPFPIDATSYDELVETLRSAAERGWPLTIHAILDSSIARVLDAMEEIDREYAVAALRWNICHAECASLESLNRVKGLGIGLALQGRLSQKAGVCGGRWGDDVVRHAPPLGDIRALGIPFGAGTDSTRGASYNPWRALWWFVTGRSVDDGPRRDPEHRLDRATALDAYTRGSAWLSFEDDRRGVLRAGADADLAVLSQDYFTVPDDDIAHTTADLTVVAGRVVHRAAAFGTVPLQDHRPRPGATLRAPVAAG